MKWRYAAVAAAIGALGVMGVAGARVSEAARQAERARAALERGLNDRLDAMTRPVLPAPAGDDAFAQAAETRLDPLLPPAEPPPQAPTSPAPAADAPPPSPGAPALPPGLPEPAADAPPTIPGAEDGPSLPSPTVVQGAPPVAPPLKPVQESPTVLEAQPTELAPPASPPRSAPTPTELEAIPSGTARTSGRARAPRPGEALPGIARQPSPFDEEPRSVSPTPGDGPADDQARALVRRLVQAEADSLLGDIDIMMKPEESPENLTHLLKGQLNNDFVHRQRRYAAEVDALEERVKKLREMIEKRQERRDQIIERRIEQLKIEAQGMGW